MIPERGRKRALIKLNEAHPGAVRMKKFARGYMWCLEIDGSIEQCFKGIWRHPMQQSNSYMSHLQH